MYRTRAGVDHSDGAYTEFEIDYTYSEGGAGDYFHPVEPASVEIQRVRVVKSTYSNNIHGLENLGPLKLTLDEVLSEEELKIIYEQLLFAVQSDQAEVIR